jgi:hypothetical protein
MAKSRKKLLRSQKKRKDLLNLKVIRNQDKNIIKNTIDTTQNEDNYNKQKELLKILIKSVTNV